MKKKFIEIMSLLLILSSISLTIVKADSRDANSNSSIATSTEATTEAATEVESIDYKREKINTKYIETNSFIDTTKEEYKILSKEEIEKLFNSIGEKSFTELTMMDINHEEKTINIQFMVNQDDGNIDTLISTGIYNLLKGTKEFINYTIKFEVTGRYTDSNQRYMKKLLYIYTYTPETLITIDWNNITLSDICGICDEMWNEETQETITLNKVAEASLQVKIINLLKYYVSEKIK